MQSKLFVQNLTVGCSERELQKLFAPFGEVLSTKIPTDRYSGRSRGFGFVEMISQVAAKSAQRQLNKMEYNGKKLYVAFSLPEQRTRIRRIAYSYLC